MTETDSNLYLYKQIKKNQKSLTEAEQLDIGREIEKIFADVAYVAWKDDDCRMMLNLEWSRRRTVTAETRGSANVSKMGRGYNSSVTGHNTGIRKRINNGFQWARLQTERGDLETGAIIFSQLQIHPTFLVTNEVIPIRARLEKIPELERHFICLDNLRGRLVDCVWRAASELAHKRFKAMSGEVIDLCDLIQVAIHEAWESTLVFDTSKNTKWSSFVYRRMQSALGKYVSEQTRTVVVPRTMLDKFGPVQEAIELVGMTDFQSIATVATQINAQKKQTSKGRKLKAREVYTPETVEYLIKHMTDVISLDVPLNESQADQKELPLAEVFSKDSMDTEAAVESSLVAKNLRAELKALLSEEEYEVIRVRWGLDGVDSDTLNLVDASKQFRQQHGGTRMNKGRVKEIELRVFNRLRSKKDGPLRDCYDALIDLRCLREE